MQLPAHWLSRFTLCSGLAALLAAGPLTHPAAAQLGEIAQFAGQIKAQLSLLKDQLKELDKDFADDLKALKAEVKADSKTPQQAHEELFLRIDQLFESQSDVLEDVIDTIEFNASEHLEQIPNLPNAMTVGDGGLIDDGLHGAVALVHLSMVKTFTKVRQFAKQLEKQEDFDLVGDHRRPIADPMTPTEDTGTPAADPLTMLRVDLLLAGSLRGPGNADDARICVAGTADPANGADVSVTLTRPGETPVVANATIDPVTHRWKVLVPETLPGTLTEGNYSVDVTQGDVTISDSIGVQ